ncbi:MAG TPA: hypothetical protein VK459_17290 [Polyangiaceae bacterium]|nr:hypothetical protein [Polyangiaceae bacterium]
MRHGRGMPPPSNENLLAHAATARKRGYAIIRGAFEGETASGWPGVCALGAYEVVARGTSLRLSLPSRLKEHAAAWDAIEDGFDGEPRRRRSKRWWNVGRRLRRALRPVKAAA